jgi:excisionase family DNA binding protein
MNHEPKTERRLSMGEAAWYLHTRPAVIQRLVLDGKLRVATTVHRHWRFNRADLDAHAERVRVWEG